MEDVKNENELENEVKNENLETSSQKNEEEKKENEALKKSKEISKKAYETAKEASKSAFNAFLKLLINPIDKQEEVIDELGNKNVLSAGIVFNVLFFIFSFLFSLRIVKMIENNPYGMFEAGFKEYFQMIFYPIFTAGLIFSAFLIIGHFITKKQKNFANHLFITGIVLFPLTVNFLLASIFLKLYFLMTIITIFGICFHIIILNGSLTGPYKLSKRNALLATPSIFSTIFIIYYLIIKIG